MRKQLLNIMMVAVLVLAVATLAVGAEDPFVGTWKANVSKSTKSANPPPKSYIAKLTPIQNGYAIVTDLVAADGKATHREWNVIFDGNDHPSGFARESIQACTRINENSFVCVIKRDGKETGRVYDVNSSDGLTGTLIFTGRDSQGKESVSIMVSDKQ
jgi:hypothetical protein